MGQVRKQQEKLVNLTPSEAQQLLNPREGFEEYVEELAALYRDNLDVMRINGFDPDAMVSEVNAYDELEATERAAQAVVDKVQKTRRLHGSNGWGAMLLVYDRARSAGRTDDNVMRGIARFEAFMKKRRHDKKTAPATPSAG